MRTDEHERGNEIHVRIFHPVFGGPAKLPLIPEVGAVALMEFKTTHLAFCVTKIAPNR